MTIELHIGKGDYTPWILKAIRTFDQDYNATANPPTLSGTFVVNAPEVRHGVDVLPPRTTIETFRDAAIVDYDAIDESTLKVKRPDNSVACVNLSSSCCMSSIVGGGSVKIPYPTN